MSSPYVDEKRAALTAEKIQRKYFRGRWNHEIMAICCILLADEIIDAEGVDREKMLDSLVQVIKKYVRMGIAN